MQIGLSPKVRWPAAILAVAGLAVLGVWLATGSGGDTNDPLFLIGCSLLGAAGVQLPVGYHAPAGEVVTTVGQPSDAALPSDAIDKLGT